MTSDLEVWMPYYFTCPRCQTLFSDDVRNRKYCSRACAFEPRPATINDDGTAFIHLSQGKRTIIDAEDAEWAEQFNWSLNTKGYVFRRARRGEDRPYGSSILLSREVMKCPEHLWVDHVNHDVRDNRRNNLRCATISENAGNMRMQKRNRAGRKGVRLVVSTNKWSARIQRDGKNIHLGCFTTPDEAARAYDAAAKEMFGEFAWVNFPD